MFCSLVNEKSRFGTKRRGVEQLLTGSSDDDDDDDYYYYYHYY